MATNFQDLLSTVKGAFEIQPADKITLSYKDEDKDDIIVESQDDLEYALKCMIKTKSSILKIYVVKSESKDIDDTYCFLNTTDYLDEKDGKEKKEERLNNMNFSIELTIDKDDEEDENFEDVSRYSQCKICRRKFNAFAMIKHQSICKEAIRRSPFMSKKQRILNIEHFMLMRNGIIKQVEREMVSPLINPINSIYSLFKKKENWKQKSNYFRNSIKNK